MKTLLTMLLFVTTLQANAKHTKIYCSTEVEGTTYILNINESIFHDRHGKGLSEKSYGISFVDKSGLIQSANYSVVNLGYDSEVLIKFSDTRLTNDMPDQLYISGVSYVSTHLSLEGLTGSQDNEYIEFSKKDCIKSEP